MEIVVEPLLGARIESLRVCIERGSGALGALGIDLECGNASCRFCTAEAAGGAAALMESGGYATDTARVAHG